MSRTGVIVALVVAALAVVWLYMRHQEQSKAPAAVGGAAPPPVAAPTGGAIISGNTSNTGYLKTGALVVGSPIIVPSVAAYAAGKAAYNTVTGWF